eukprot:GEMP01036235.1.p1 GENE.GEMP01036235.1~~GEMP01036235.1.p1  ORF type:complete len:313 (+),score=95.48 GEMP01036235.1:190-1128(+)
MSMWKTAALAAGAINIAFALAYLRRRRLDARNSARRTRPKGSQPVRIHLLRHGETENNKRTSDQNSGAKTTKERNCDPVLTELGKKQAESFAAYVHENFADLNIKKVYCSPMMKALQTLKPIAHLLNGKVPVAINIDLFERGGVFNGDRSLSAAERSKLPLAHGSNWNDLVRAVPQLRFEDIANPCRYSDWGPPSTDGWWMGRRETDKQYTQRVERLADWLWALEENTLIVAHGKMFDTLIKCLIMGRVDKEKEKAVLFLHAGCSFTVLELREARMAFMGTNQHVIPSKLRTGHSLEKFTTAKIDIQPRKHF